MKTDRFERRDLKPYAEPVTAKDLKEQSVYFFVNYSDEAMLLPTMEAVVFVGRNLEPGDEGQVYFQDLDSFQRGIRYGSPDEIEEALFSSGSESETGHIFEYEQALDELIRCSQRRAKANQR